MALIEVRLRPTGPWRVGHRGGDRERVDVIYHSDALFSALTHAMLGVSRDDLYSDYLLSNAAPGMEARVVLLRERLSKRAGSELSLASVKAAFMMLRQWPSLFIQPSTTAALLVYPGLGVKSVKELIAYAQARPGKILFGASAAGSSTHINAERFRLAAGIQAKHVGFKGQPEFLIEIAAGRVQFGVSGIGAAMSLIRNGQLLPLAITSQKRAAALPDVPTAAEVLPGWGNDGSHALFAPATTPRAIVQQLNREVNRALDAPDLRERLSGIDFNIHTATPEEFDKALQSDIVLFTRIAKEAGLRAK